jgi:hypothetical protein
MIELLTLWLEEKERKHEFSSKWNACFKKYYWQHCFASQEMVMRRGTILNEQLTDRE